MDTDHADSPPASSQLRRLADLVRVALAGLTAISLAAVVVSSVILLRRYRPDLQVDDFSSFVDDGELRYAPREWVYLHERALSVAVSSSLLWGALTAVLVRTRSRGSTVVCLSATALTVVCTMVASMTWGLVRWDQVALWSVMNGEFMFRPGLWKPAVSDEVRFLLIGGAEVGQGTYLRALVVHLATPVVALLALVVATFSGRHRPASPGSTEVDHEALDAR